MSKFTCGLFSNLFLASMLWAQTPPLSLQQIKPSDTMTQTRNKLNSNFSTLSITSAPSAWGSITGQLINQLDLYAYLTNTATIVQGVTGNLKTQKSYDVSGKVIAWGYNDFGQTTVPIDATTSVVAIAAGDTHALALRSDGRAIAWGYNGYGECDVPSAASNSIVAIAAGGFHCMALRADGRVVDWGYGSGSIPSIASNSVIAIASGDQHSLVVLSCGRVVAWGNNSSGQCNVPPMASNSVVAVAAGDFISLALRTDGNVVVWGDNSGGACNVPASVTNSVIAIASSGMHSIALRSDGCVFAWGRNDFGQCDVPPAASNAVIAIGGGWLKTCALRSDGTVVIWGRNYGGMENIPVLGSNSIIAISGGSAWGMDLRGIKTICDTSVKGTLNLNNNPLILGGISRTDWPSSTDGSTFTNILSSWGFTDPFPTNAVFNIQRSATVPYAVRITNLGTVIGDGQAVWDLVTYANRTNRIENYITVITGMVATITYSNRIVDVSIPVGYSWGVVTTNTAGSTNLWIDVDYQ